jgi:RNA recognition motif-containing protein
MPLFPKFGTVEDINIVTDRDTGQARGFGFVEMREASEAQNAISQLNGTGLHGRTLNVNEARPKPLSRQVRRISKGRGRYRT